MKILRAVALVAVAVTVAVGGVPVTAAAADGAPTPNRGTVPAPNEYFADMWQDPMDFANPADFDTTPRHMVQQGGAALNGGRLHLWNAQQVFLLRSDPGSYPTTATRDPRARPLDADKYRQVRFRMHSDRQADAAIYFRQCNSCPNGLKYFRVKPGWHSYVLDMTGGGDWEGLPTATLPPVSGARWSGDIEMMWMITSFDAGNLPALALDDFGIVEPTADIGVSIPASAGPSQLWVDFNDTATDSYIGEVRPSSYVGVPGATLRRGSRAQFYTVRNGVRSAASAQVSMPRASTPSPRTLTPWEGGGQDWATVARWDPWDMNQPTDASVRNAASAFAWGSLHGWTAGGTVNDPEVSLSLNKPIDASLYHRLAITIDYEGPWGLQDGPGGGMVGRIMWHPWGSGWGSTQVSDDIVLRTGRATYYVDLKTWPPSRILEPGANFDPIGWGTGRASWVDAVSFHPHEDRGARSWHIEDVKLLRNDVVDRANPRFDIKFIDDAWAPGTVADIIADPNLDPNDPAQVVIARNVPVHQGINVYRWNGWPAARGTYHIRVQMRRGDRVGSSYSMAAVDRDPVGAAWPPAVGNGIVK